VKLTGEADGPVTVKQAIKPKLQRNTKIIVGSADRSVPEITIRRDAGPRHIVKYIQVEYGTKAGDVSREGLTLTSEFSKAILGSQLKGRSQAEIRAHFKIAAVVPLLVCCAGVPHGGIKGGSWRSPASGNHAPHNNEYTAEVGYHSGVTVRDGSTRVNHCKDLR